MEIRLFKTSISDQSVPDEIESGLNRILKEKQWNFDLDDCDKILRIEAGQIPERKLFEFMKKKNIRISEIY